MCLVNPFKYASFGTPFILKHYVLWRNQQLINIPVESYQLMDEPNIPIYLMSICLYPMELPLSSAL